ESRSVGEGPVLVAQKICNHREAGGDDPDGQVRGVEQIDEQEHEDRTASYYGHIEKQESPDLESGQTAGFEGPVLVEDEAVEHAGCGSQRIRDGSVDRMDSMGCEHPGYFRAVASQCVENERRQRKHAIAEHESGEADRDIDAADYDEAAELSDTGGSGEQGAHRSTAATVLASGCEDGSDATGRDSLM